MTEDEVFQAWVKAIRDAEKGAASGFTGARARDLADRALFIKLKELARDMRHVCADAYSEVANGAGAYEAIMNAQLTLPRGK